MKQTVLAIYLASMVLVTSGCGTSNEAIKPSSTVAYSKDDKPLNPGVKRNNPPPIPPPPGK